MAKIRAVVGKFSGPSQIPLDTGAEVAETGGKWGVVGRSGA
jgi:hypothetical protein